MSKVNRLLASKGKFPVLQPWMHPSPLRIRDKLSPWVAWVSHIFLWSAPCRPQLVTRYQMIQQFLCSESVPNILLWRHHEYLVNNVLQDSLREGKGQETFPWTLLPLLHSHPPIPPRFSPEIEVFKQLACVWWKATNVYAHLALSET